jgi:hypothetical protein
VGWEGEGELAGGHVTDAPPRRSLSTVPSASGTPAGTGTCTVRGCHSRLMATTAVSWPLERPYT